MEINVKKTVLMAISKEPDIRINVTIDRKELSQVDHFKYLGSFVTTDCKSNMDIRTKVAEAKRAFGEMKTILTNNKIPLPLRMRIHRCYVEPIMLYGCETWTLLKKDKKETRISRNVVYETNAESQVDRKGHKRRSIASNE